MEQTLPYKSKLFFNFNPLFPSFNLTMASWSDLASKRQRFAAPIPEELVVEICKRMPPESVGRSMCVCKAWKSLLSSPFFIALHHHHSSASTPEFQQPRLLFEKQPIPFPFNIRKKKPTPPRNFSGSTIESRCFPTVGSHHDVQELIGVVKGVACVLLISSEDSSTNTIILWNPLIRKYVELPDLPPPPEVNPKEISVGVGFLDDFRVIRVWKQFQGRMVYDVYSFKTGVWKRKVAENISLPPGGFSYSSGFFFKGTLNWMLQPSFSPRHLLFSVLMFDCEREEFRLVPLPEAVFDMAPFPKLAEFGGMLAFVRSKMWGMTTSISDSNSKVWMLLGDTPDHIANNDVFVSTGSLLLMDHAAAKPVVSLDDDSNGKAANRKYLFMY